MARHNWSYKYKGSMQAGYCYCLVCGITKWKGAGGDHDYYVDSEKGSWNAPNCEAVTEEKMKMRIELFNRIVSVGG